MPQCCTVREKFGMEQSNVMNFGLDHAPRAASIGLPRYIY